jgi:hypothetical protein
MKRGILTFALLIVFSICLFAYAEDSEYGRVVGDRKYFVENPAPGGGRDYIVRNPKATLPLSDIPLAKMDSVQQVCCLWGKDQGLAYFNNDSFDPKISVLHDCIHIVWWQQFHSDKTSYLETFYIASLDGGYTWQDSLALSPVDEEQSPQPDIAVVDQNVYVVWYDWCTISQDCGIYFTKSTDGGETWLPAVGIALAGPDYYKCHKPTIAAQDSEVYVAYGKDIDLDGSLRFKKSSDYGESWENETTVSEAAVGGYPPELVVNSGGLHLVAQHGWNNSVEIFYNRSTDFGDSWESYIPISELDDIPSQWPSIAADNSGNIYITWFDYKYSPYPWTGDIFLRKSTDNGESWFPIVSLTDQHKAVASDVFAKDNTVHVVWEDQRHGSDNDEIYYRRSEDQGDSWLGEERLTDAPGNSNNPRVTCYWNRTDVTWTDARDLFHRDLFYKNGYKYMVGDVNSNFNINSSDMVYLINFLFKNGPSPFVAESGDVNQDQIINSADIVYLINYLFRNGPAPSGC